MWAGHARDGRVTCSTAPVGGCLVEHILVTALFGWQRRATFPAHSREHRASVGLSGQGWPWRMEKRGRGFQDSFGWAEVFARRREAFSYCREIKTNSPVPFWKRNKIINSSGPTAIISTCEILIRKRKRNAETKTFGFPRKNQKGSKLTKFLSGVCAKSN